MDPDRSLALGLCAFSLGMLFYLLAALGRAQQPEEDTPLGADSAPLGLVALCVLFAGAAGALLAAALPRLAWFWWLVPAVLVPACGVLCFSLGRAARAADRPLSGLARAAGRLAGALFAAPARGIFAAAKLSAAKPVTEEDILDLVDDVQEGEGIDESQKEMISGVFELDDIEAGDIMTHRTDMEALEDTDSAATAIAAARENGFSRLPVFRKNLDDIVGILHVKDLLGLPDREAENRPVAEFMRGVMFVPESCHARELLLDFKQKHTQSAIVVDEYGGTAGIVTMEDILEEIVGNIQDEFDREEEEIRPVEGGLVAEGATDLEDVFDRLGLAMPRREEDEDFDSVGGMILQRLGRFPAPGEDVTVTFGPLRCRVLESGERRIERVLCTPAPEPEAEKG